MTRILQWTDADLEGLGNAYGLSRIIIEVDDSGLVTRELRFDAEGNLIHGRPGEPALAKYGVFDLAKIAPSERAHMSVDEFERLWSA